MVVIRLARTGANKRPFYHIVAADRRRPLKGRCIERLGYFNPIAAGKEIPLHMDYERIQHWLSKGAQPSERIQSLIKTYLEQQAATPPSGETQAA
jgi:small subunit ribosomal protein S16